MYSDFTLVGKLEDMEVPLERPIPVKTKSKKTISFVMENLGVEEHILGWWENEAQVLYTALLLWKNKLASTSEALPL